MTNGKVWAYIYKHPWQFFGATIFLIVVLVLLIGFVLDSDFSPADHELRATVQAVETQVAR